jgi:hypothetical protein
MKLQGNEKKHGGGNYVMRKTAAKMVIFMTLTPTNHVAAKGEENVEIRKSRSSHYSTIAIHP